MVQVKQFPESEATAKLSLYIPPHKGGQDALRRLRDLAERRDRSLNYVAIEAILEYLERQERRR